MRTPSQIFHPTDLVCDHCEHTKQSFQLITINSFEGSQTLCDDCLQNWIETACQSELILNKELANDFGIEIEP